MLTLYFVRHGETLSNVWNYMQGWSDTPLTTKGIAQGKRAANLLKDISFLAIYTSTSERAYDTACLINEYHHLQIRMCKGLKELNFGTLEVHPEHIIGGPPCYRMNYDWHLFGGENIHDLTRRIGKTIQDIAMCHKDEDGNILCVTHSIAILAAIRYVDETVYNNRMKNEEYIENCSVTTMEWENGKFKITRINETNCL